MSKFDNKRKKTKLFISVFSVVTCILNATLKLKAKWGSLLNFSVEFQQRIHRIWVGSLLVSSFKFYLSRINLQCEMSPRKQPSVSTCCGMRLCWIRGCGACHCVLPVVCLHSSLLSLGSLVCESQLSWLLIRASPLNMSACYNACRVAIFYPFCPWVLWVVRECGNAFTAGGTQTISLCDGGEDRDGFTLLMRLITHTHTHIGMFKLSWNGLAVAICLTVTPSPHGHHVFYPVGLSLCCCSFPLSFALTQCKNNE